MSPSGLIFFTLQEGIIKAHWICPEMSTTDLWTFTVASAHRRETVTILATGKDGFRVSKEQFIKLNRQIQCWGLIYSSQSAMAARARGNLVPHFLGWTPSSNRNDKSLNSSTKNPSRCSSTSTKRPGVVVETDHNDKAQNWYVDLTETDALSGI